MHATLLADAATSTYLLVFAQGRAEFLHAVVHGSERLRGAERPLLQLRDQFVIRRGLPLQHPNPPLEVLQCREAKRQQRGRALPAGNPAAAAHHHRGVSGPTTPPIFSLPLLFKYICRHIHAHTHMHMHIHSCMRKQTGAVECKRART